jgi:GNAT superfamily N-acetyltransferase
LTHYQLFNMKLKCSEADFKDLQYILMLYADALDNNTVIGINKAKVIYEKMKTYPNYKVYVAAYDNEIVGTFALLIMENLAHQGTPSAVVEDVAVLSKYQGKGIGKYMMEYAIQKSKEAGCYKMVLSSNLKRTEAHAFYESLGFEKHGYSFRVDF